MRKPSASRRYRSPSLAPQMRTAFARIAWKTASSSPGELEMMRSTSEVAVCCSSDSESARVRASSSVSSSRACALSFSSSSARGSRIRPRRAAFVLVERTLRPRARLLAPLGDKVTWIAPCWLSHAEDQVLQVGTLGWRPESELSRERRAPSIPWQSPLSTNRRSHNEHPLGIIPVNEKCDLHFLDSLHGSPPGWVKPRPRRLQIAHEACASLPASITSLI